ncbi:hypothetical protein JXA34_03285 [Patescibacteria group bacterium]|nr:hypothetical protein [Patescibacteria group bacterium]
MSRLTLEGKIKVIKSYLNVEEVVSTNAVLLDNIARHHSEIEDIDLSVAIRYVNYFVENFEELFKQQEDPFKKAALFGLIFDEVPTYEQLLKRRMSLSCFFELNLGRQYKEKPMVTESLVILNTQINSFVVFEGNLVWFFFLY